jgi:hypothetical protein
MQLDKGLPEEIAVGGCTIVGLDIVGKKLGLVRETYWEIVTKSFLN